MRKVVPLFLLILLLSSCAVKEPTAVLNAGVDTVSQFSIYTPEPCMLETNEATYQMKIVTNDVNTGVEGTYTVLYSYTYEEIEYTCQRKVFVSDDTPPTVTLKQGIDTVVLGHEWTDMSVEYSDTNSTLLQLTVDNPVDTSKLGSYVVTYTVIDENGNEGFAYRHVNVIEE